MIKVLFLTANPFIDFKFDFAKEYRGIAEAFEKAPYSEQLLLEYERDVKFSELQELFTKHKPDIVHFSVPGHYERGLFFADSFPKGSRPGEREFEQGWNATDWYKLGVLFQENRIRCLVLLIPIPPQIAEQLSYNIPAIVGVDRIISLSQTAAFSAGFYEGLGSGKGISYAMKQGSYEYTKSDDFGDSRFPGKPTIHWSPGFDTEAPNILTLPETTDEIEYATPKALIMKGGGVKGLAYVGSLREVKKYYDFDWYVGTSAGAIAAVLLGAGYTIDELEKILVEKNFQDFLDAKPYQWLTNLLFYKGLFPADELTNWLENLLATKLESATQVKLGALPNRVTVYASQRNKKAKIFDSNDDATKDIPAAFAVRCSMAIPFVFWPQMDQGMRVLDGGIQNNYPVDILLEGHPSVEFIGLYLGPEIYEGENRKISLLGDLLSIWTEASDVENLEKYQKQTVIIDPRPISTIDFKLSDIEKTFLLKAGQVAAIRFLRKNKDFTEQTDEKDLDLLQQEVSNLREIITAERKKKKRHIILMILALTILILALVVVIRMIQ